VGYVGVATFNGVPGVPLPATAQPHDARDQLSRLVPPVVLFRKKAILTAPSNGTERFKI
jgi:hypothetical protein